MPAHKIYDVIGIGIGPFNLGLAALAHDLPELNCLFFDGKEQFNWHPGMLIPGTRMQVPFYADLVTLANPCSKFSYFCFLKAKERMIRFGVLENIYPLRTEYNQYCRWVAGQLPALQFGYTCREVSYDQSRKCYKIMVSTGNRENLVFYSKHIVIGIGTVPQLPNCAATVNHPMVFHSADYLFKKIELLKQKNITVIGSGQSAAEIFSDLLHHADKWQSLSWFTRSQRISPMDFSKFALELASPAYMDHFYQLPADRKANVLAGQDNLYKRINMDTMSAMYEQLHLLEQTGTDNRIQIMPGASLQAISVLPDNRLQLDIAHCVTQKNFLHITDALILATGYQNIIPDFLRPVHDQVQWTPDKQYDVQRNYSIDKNNTLFIQNADLHTHGFNSADLSMGPYRNAVILNTILGREHFTIEKGSLFQSFYPY